MPRGAASIISAEEVSGPDRYAGPANPVGAIAQPSREMAPVTEGAPPRVQHPSLNGLPWSTSMAVKRSEPRSVKGGRKRQRKGKAS